MIIMGNSVYWFLSMDTLLQRLTQISTSKSIEQSWTNQGWKDIFLTTLWNFNASESTSTLQSISHITNNLISRAQASWLSCNTTNNDILLVLLNSPQFVVELYNDSNIALSQGIEIQWDLKVSCEKILSCTGNLKNWQGITDTTRQISACKTIILNTYTTNKKLASNFANIPLANNNDNIYMDSIKENGLFDIMIDIENIEKILFDPWTQWPELPKMIYYSLPTVSSPSQNTNNSTPWNVTTNGNNIWPSLSGNVLIWNSTGSNLSWSGVWDTIWTNNNFSISSEIDTFLFNTTSPISPSLSDPLWNIPTTSISQAICLPEDNSNDFSLSTSWSTSIGELPESTNIIDDFTNLQNDLLDAMSWYIYNLWYNPNNIGNNNFWQNFIETQWAVPSTTATCRADCANTEWTEKLICEWKCCMNSCNQISNISDRAICLSQCLCGEASIANDTLRIKICRVPAQPSRVMAWKTITSIEQAVDEINQIFLKLKQNWALVKKTKTQEFLDSSFSSIKLHKILAFDIFVAIKPIYDILQVDQVKKKAEDDHTILAKINNTTGEKGQWQDRNKYSTSWLHGTLEQNNKYCQSYGWTYNSITKKCNWSTNNKDIIKELSQSQSINLRNDTLYVFLSEHYTFWDEVYNQIVEIQTTSENLRTKAEAAQ